MLLRVAFLRRQRPGPVQTDVLLGGFFAIAGEANVWLGHVAGRERFVAAVLVLFSAGAVAIRRRYPTLAGTGAGVLNGLVIALWGDPQVISNGLATLCALYALAVWSPPRRFAAGITAVTGASLIPGPRFDSRALWALGSLVVILIVRRVVRDRDTRAQLIERERDLAMREAVAEERARIARELHDVVAHGVSVMVVQAQAGPRLVHDPAQATSVFRSIESAGREALVEMRRLLGILRTVDTEIAIGPQPGLASLPSLVEQVRAAGLQTVLHVEGEPIPLPPGIDLSAYRIVQEALTNTLKHAGDAEAEVIVRYDPRGLELEVVDNGCGTSSPGRGNGLIGMRERVALYGGALEVGPRNGHGYAVRARLPLAGGVAR